MKIYFCGSICGGQNDLDLYGRLIEHLRTYGRVLTEHVGNTTMLKVDANTDNKTIHDRDLAWLQETDVVIAEVTQPSLGVGYEIGRAIVLDKPILCLFRPECGRRLSSIIEGAKDDKRFFVNYYKEAEVFPIIKKFMEKFKIQAAEEGAENGNKKE